MELIVINKEELKEIITATTKEAVLMYIRESKEYPDLLSKKMALEYINKKSPTTIDNYIKNNKLHPIYRNNRPYFRKSELQKLKAK